MTGRDVGLGPVRRRRSPTMLAERMSLVARTLQQQTSAQDVLQAAADAAVVHVAGCEAAGLALVHPRRRVDMPAFTSPEVRTADLVQTATGEGPCLDAIWHSETVHSSDFAHDARWPAWGPEVAEQTGLRSVLSLRVYTATDTVGALNLYATSCRAFTGEDHVDGTALAAQVAVAAHAARQIERLEASRLTRSVIGQALGIVMERYDLDAGQAWALLTRLSSEREVKIHHLAAELVSTRAVPGSSEVGGLS